MCSRLCTGSASMPTSAEQARRGRRDALAEQVAVVEHDLRGGAGKDFRIESGMPALLPGV